MHTRRRLEFIHEGKYAAEVPVELEYSDEGWSPDVGSLPAAASCSFTPTTIVQHVTRTDRSAIF